MKTSLHFSLVLFAFFIVACNSTTTTNNNNRTGVDSTALIDTAITNNLSTTPTGTYTYGDKESEEGGGYLAIQQQGDSLWQLELQIPQLTGE